MKLINIILPCCIILATMACKDKTRFELLTSDQTGISFQNKLEETPQMNVFTYLYFYNGGGVAAGDLNGDGLPDLYFTANLDSNRLYLNNGDFKFTDITVPANVSGKKGWTTGVTMADVNGDGKLDIYVSQLGDYKNIIGKNQLYINLGNDENGIPRFEDQAKQWGLDLKGFSTQAAFFDYDLDGDLDMFMLNHSVHSNGTYGKSDLRTEFHPLSGDKLMRNDGSTFTDVTKESGIYSSVIGYGLGVTVGDINWDGYPDIYVGNDFHENDYLYISNGDGTFTEQLEASIQHTSRFSMGNDIGDINNDGFPDILSLDMLPADPKMLKSSAGEDAYDIYHFKLGFGYNHQFARNTLQLNLGNGRFSEIALLSGIAATDWSWSGLFADLDLDGYKDIFISNGIKRRMNDLDYINFVSNEAIQHRLEGDLTSEDLALVAKMPIVKIPNYIFRNNGDLTFQEMSKEWGLNQDSFSNGSIHVDLDNDGDLDLVTNNIDQEAFIYRNNTLSAKATKSDEGNTYIKIKFEGKSPNLNGIGSKVIIPTDKGKITAEVFPTRGYQSAVHTDLLIGLGEMSTIDSIFIIWPDNRFEVLRDVATNQTIIVKQESAKNLYDYEHPDKTIFKEVSDQFALDYKHEENNFIEFNREGLIPHMSSTEGPPLVIGDVNGDGKDDFFVGGAKRQLAKLYIQQDSGFAQQYQEIFKTDSLHEDTDATFVDVDKDEDMDLVVLSGGNEFRNNDSALQLRIYSNDGKGNFSKDPTKQPEIYLTGSCVRPADFDADGDIDLFLGGRVVPWNYGEIPNSYLLENDGDGNFKDVTFEKARELQKVGLVKDASWADMNGDGQLDLVILGEWMPVTIFLNSEGTLTKEKSGGLELSHGWWNTLQIEDIDEDGDLDILGGNLGLNSKLKASEEEPVSLYVKDFDQNGKKEQLLYHFIGGEENLFATKDELVKQLPSLKNKFIKYNDFALADPEEIFSKKELQDAEKLVAHELRSGIFVNDGEMNFTFEPFPLQAQISTINSILLDDFDNDGAKDILAGGNFFALNIQMGRYDASYGLLLKNLGDAAFQYVPQHKSGLEITGQISTINTLLFKNEKYFIISRNNETIKFLKLSDDKEPLISKNL